MRSRVQEVGAVLGVGLAAAIAGCNNSDDSLEIHINAGNTKARIIANQGPNTPTGPLTVAEQKKLLKAIRKDPDRIRTLTNRERRWLAGIALED